MAKSDEKTAMHVGFVETFRIFKPSYRTDSYGNNSVTICFFFILNMSLAYLLYKIYFHYA